MARTKNSINWASKEELSWMGNLLSQSPMTRVQLLVECEKHYGVKISKSSLENQISRLKNLTYLQEDDGKFCYPIEMIGQVVDFINDLSDEDIKGSQDHDDKEKKSWVTNNSLKKMLDVFYMLKEHNFNWDFNRFAEKFSQVHGQKLSASEFTKFNEYIYPGIGYLPYSFTKKGALVFNTNDQNTKEFPNQIMNLINSRGKKKDHLSNHLVIYDEEKLKADEINFGLMIKEARGFGISFEAIIQGWQSRYGQPIEKEYVSYMSKDLLVKCRDNFTVNSKMYYIKNFQKFVKSVDPSRLSIDIVLVTNQSIPTEYHVMDSFEVGNGETAYSIKANNDEKLHKFLRRLVARKNGRILYPHSLSEKLRKEFDKVMDDYLNSPSDGFLQ
jgi:hypothetical protein